MPRQVRVDGPGASHHVMARGIARTQIVQVAIDRNDFVARLAASCREGQLVVYAWPRISNHFPLRVRPGQSPLVRTMTKLLTGDGATVNRRHKRVG